LTDGFGIWCQSVDWLDLRFDPVFGVVRGHFVGIVIRDSVVIGQFGDGFGDFGEDVAVFEERVFHLNLFVFDLMDLFIYWEVA
jgi:hypothetical protein